MGSRFLVLGSWCLVLGAWCLVLGAWCLVLGAQFLVLGSWKVDVGAAGDTRYLAGFYGVEQADGDFRWSGPDARLVFYGVSNNPALLRLHIHSSPPEPAQTQQLQVGRGKQGLAQFTVGSGWRTYHLLLPAGALTDTGFAPVALNLVTSGYQPVSSDERELGLPLDWFAVQPLTPVSVSWAVPLQRALLLLWGVAVLAAVLRPLNAALTPGRNRATALFHLGVQSGATTLLLAGWAWYDPFSLGWAWSQSPQVLPTATGLLGLGVLLRRLVPYAVPRVRMLGVGRQPLRLPTIVLPSRSVGGWLLLTLLAVAHGLLFVPLPVAWQGTVAWLILALPGGVLALLLSRDEPDWLARGFLALCGGLVLAPLGLLVLQALPGPMPWWALLLVCDGLVLVSLRAFPPGQAAAQSQAAACFRVGWRHIALGVVLVVAAFFRLVYLGSAEFQGDEGQPMLMAVHLLHGQDDILLLHRKGPLEVLLPAAPLVLTGTINEWVARLPFAVAGVGIVLGAYLLAERMFRWQAVGLVAAGLLALDGFMIAFSRIVQYQNVVVLLTLAALWCCWRFYAGGAHRYLILAAIFAAVGLLGHYDGIFGLPAMAYLVVVGGWQRGWRGPIQWVRGLTLPVAAGAGLLGSFYVPFVLHDSFANTADYLVTMRIGAREASGATLNNLVSYFPLVTFYNTIYHIAALAALLALALLVWLGAYVRPHLVGGALAGLLLTACALLGWHPAAFQLAPGFNWAIVAFGLPLAGLVLAPGLPLALRTVLVWFSVPFIVQSFIIANPNTHFYTMHPAAALLMGVFVVQTAGWLWRRRAGWVLAPVVLGASGLVLLMLPYLYLLFLQQHPEYQRTFPAARPNLYLASYGDELPRGGFFGFPHRDGWKVIGELFRQGVLQGSYDSNQKALVTLWYVRDGVRGGTPPDYYFGALFEPYLFIPRDYHLYGSVLVDGQRVLAIYQRLPVEQAPRLFHLDDYAAQFDGRPVPNLPVNPQLFDIRSRTGP